MNFPVLAGAEPFRFDAGQVGALLLHGFSGCPASMRPMGRWLAERGVSSVGPRMPGHGTDWRDLEATSWKDWEREAEAALVDLRSRCRSVIAVGLSVGGAMALHLAAGHREALVGVAAVNPMVRRADLRLAPLARVFTRTVKGVGNDIKKPGQDEFVYDRIPLRAAHQLGRFLRTVQRELPAVALPLIVFSSPEDHTVKPADARYAYERVGSATKELVLLPNSYHVATLDYDAETIFERTLRFAAALPSGAPSPAG